MPKCRQCAHARPMDADPTRAICSATRKEAGTATKFTIEGKVVSMSDESCEVFVDKKSVDRTQILRDGFA